MSRARDALATSADAVLDLLVDMLADRVVARLGAVATPDYYDQRNNPLGRRRFLEAARRGAFPSSRQGKLVLARRDDVDRWIAAGRRARAEVPKADEVLTDEDLLAANGIELAPAPRGVKR